MKKTIVAILIILGLAGASYYIIPTFKVESPYPLQEGRAFSPQPGETIRFVIDNATTRGDGCESIILLQETEDEELIRTSKEFFEECITFDFGLGFQLVISPLSTPYYYSSPSRHELFPRYRDFFYFNTLPPERIGFYDGIEKKLPVLPENEEFYVDLIENDHNQMHEFHKQSLKLLRDPIEFEFTYLPDGPSSNVLEQMHIFRIEPLDVSYTFKPFLFTYTIHDPEKLHQLLLDQDLCSAHRKSDGELSRKDCIRKNFNVGEEEAFIKYPYADLKDKPIHILNPLKGSSPFLYKVWQCIAKGDPIHDENGFCIGNR